MPVTIHCPSCPNRLTVPALQEGRNLQPRHRCGSCQTVVVLHRGKGLEGNPEDSAVTLGEQVQVPGYTLLGVLGRGGMGVVYAAARQSDSRLVALKILSPEAAAYQELVERFDHEAQMMCRISHAGLVPLLDRGRAGRHEFLVAEYIPSCTLKDRIRHGAPLSLAETLAITNSIAEAVQACHDQQLVHRDLKPANVLLSQDGRVMVTDFGLANLITHLGELTEAGAVMGTPDYAAPEQRADGSDITVAADQYSLGVMVFEMLTGHLPTGGMSLTHSDAHGGSAMTPEVKRVLERALAWNPEKRFSSIKAFSEKLSEAAPLPEGLPHPKQIIRSAARRTPPIASQPFAPVPAAPARPRLGRKPPAGKPDAKERLPFDLTPAPHAAGTTPMPLHTSGPLVGGDMLPLFLAGVAAVLLAAAVILGVLLMA